jgi:hypothetical protein
MHGTDLKSGFAFVGGLIGAAAIVAVSLLISLFNWIVIVSILGFILVAYILAAIGKTSGFGEFMRGTLIGVNSGLNTMLLILIVNAISNSLPAAIGVGAFLGVVTFISVFEPVSQAEFYQGVVGWFNWLLPMSWLVSGLGLLFFLFNLIGIKGGAIDWKTGTFFAKGGWIANLNAWDTAFNMGNFAFVDINSSDMHIEHEAGHTLNLAVFGSWFHLIGAFDEIVLRHGNAYSEQLAESNASHSNIPMWI